MLSLFRRTPKWQSPKPETRIEALKDLQIQQSEDAAILLKLAQEDESITVRSHAIGYLTDLDLVSQIQKRDNNDSVRLAAGNRLQTLLAGKSSPSISLEQRLQYIERLSDNALLYHLIQTSEEQDIRLKAVSLINDEDLLAKIIQETSSSKIRQLAAEKIHDENRLELLTKVTQSKDKNTYRTLKQRLDHLHTDKKQKEQQQQKLLSLCEAMEAHSRSAMTPLYAAKTESLYQQWTEFSQSVSDAALTERFETAYGMARALSQEIYLTEQKAADTLRAKEEQNNCIQTLEASLQQYQGQDDFDLPALSAIQRTQKIRWDIANSIILANEPLQQRYSKLVTQVDQLINLLQQWQKDKGTVQHTLQQLETANNEEKPALLQILQPIQESYSAFEFILPKALQEISGFVPTPTPALAPTPQKTTNDEQKQHYSTLNTMLDKVIQEIKGGHSRQAAKQLKKSREFAKNHHLHSNRIADLTHQLNELQSWAGFAVLPKKEALIAQMQALITHEQDPDDKADAIQALQEEWRSLGVTDARSENPLWEQFKTAADEAFEPCRAHFATQKELRHQNLAQRKQLCEQLQTYLDSLPEQPDWKTHVVILQTARQEWQRYHPSDRQETRALFDQFNRILKSLEAPLQAARQQNEAEKRKLIEQAKVLNTLDDSRKACDSARNLQQSWKSIGQAHPSVDHKLWHEFRQACDLVFKKRDHEYQEKQQQQNEQIMQADTLIASMMALKDVEANTLHEEVKKLDALFQQLHLPRDKQAALKNQYQAARKNIELKIKDYKTAVQQQKIKKTLTTWEALELTSDPQTATQKIHEALLDLEIMLNMDSPAEWQSQRLQRQMQHLQNRGLRKSQQEDARTLLDALLKTPAPLEIRTATRQRLQRILSQCS